MNRTDTLKKTERDILLFLREEAPAPLRGTTAYARVLAALDEGKTSRRVHLTFDAEFEPGRAEASLEVTLEVDFREPQTETDAEGNKWARYHLKVEVNWPTWGSSLPTLANQRISHMQHVATLAAALENRFREVEVWSIWMTAEEVKKSEAQGQYLRVEGAFRTDLHLSTRRMKVGGSRLFKREAFAVTPKWLETSGTWKVDVKNGTFEVTVDNKGTATVTRTA